MALEVVVVLGVRVVGLMEVGVASRDRGRKGVLLCGGGRVWRLLCAGVAQRVMACLVVGDAVAQLLER